MYFCGDYNGRKNATSPYDFENAVERTRVLLGCAIKLSVRSENRELLRNLARILYITEKFEMKNGGPIDDKFEADFREDAEKIGRIIDSYTNS
jgi:hypothetical protein